MALLKGKHHVKEIGGTLCTVVESGISAERMNFLKKLLEHNNFEVKIERDKTEAAPKAGSETNPESAPGAEQKPETFTLGVTDLVFNPMIAVYEHSLNRQQGGKVSPNYWNQVEEIPGTPYFEYRKRNPNAVNEDEFLPVTHNYSTV